MSGSIQKAVNAAFKVFSRRNGASFSRDSFTEIKNHLNNVTKKELNLDPKVLEAKTAGVGEAPVTYIRVMEDQLMTVCIFVMRQGIQLPLHDHPHMTGFLKVVHGSITINTYTPLDPSQYPIPSTLTEKLTNKYGKYIRVYPTKFEGSSVLSETDECCELTPAGKNFHEILSEFGTAAFLDVLSPPYNDSHQSKQDNRPCNYYREIDRDRSDSDIRYLVRINAPDEYWCDEVDYTGPVLRTEN